MMAITGIPGTLAEMTYTVCEANMSKSTQQLQIADKGEEQLKNVDSNQHPPIFCNEKKRKGWGTWKMEAQQPRIEL